MAQIEEDDLKNYILKRFDCEDPFFMEIFALKVDDAGYMVFPGPTIVNSWIDLTKSCQISAQSVQKWLRYRLFRVCLGWGGGGGCLRRIT